MKHILALILALMIGTTVVCPAAAAENDFVPSISYKDGPEIGDAVIVEKEETEDPENPSPQKPVGSCLVVTSTTQAKEKTTDIYQEERDLLLEIYEQLADGEMKLPLEKDYVIRDLVDVSFKKMPCVENDHQHEEEMDQPETKLVATFDLGVPAGVPVDVLTYRNGEWIPAERVVNNGDGTITVTFRYIGPVAFCVEPGINILPPKTGDAFRRELILWTFLLVLSATAIPLLLIYREKSQKKHRRHRH